MILSTLSDAELLRYADTYASTATALEIEMSRRLYECVNGRPAYEDELLAILEAHDADDIGVLEALFAHGR